MADQSTGRLGDLKLRENYAFVFCLFGQEAIYYLEALAVTAVYDECGGVKLYWTCMDAAMDEVMLQKCIDAGLRMTSQREAIAKALDQSFDHPDAELLYQRAHDIDPTISFATIYRTLGVFERAGLVQKVDVGDGKSHYEIARDQHEHLVDTENGQIHEFKSEELTILLSKIADKMGFELTSHKLEVYGKKHGDVSCRCIQIKVY